MANITPIANGEAALSVRTKLNTAIAEVNALDTAAQQPATAFLQTLIYDPRGFETDAFNLSNLTGSIDGGVFT